MIYGLNLHSKYRSSSMGYKSMEEVRADIEKYIPSFYSSYEITDLTKPFSNRFCENIIEKGGQFPGAEIVFDKTGETVDFDSKESFLKAYKEAVEIYGGDNIGWHTFDSEAKEAIFDYWEEKENSETEEKATLFDRIKNHFINLFNLNKAELSNQEFVNRADAMFETIVASCENESSFDNDIDMTGE